MTTDDLFTGLIFLAASANLAVLVYRARTSRISSELLYMKALLMAYFMALTAELLIGHRPLLTLNLFRPVMAALFFLYFLSELVEAKRRRE